MAALQAVSAIAEGVTLLNVVTCLATPVAHFAIVLAPGMHGTIVNSDLSFTSLFAFEVGGLVHVMVDATMDAGDGIGSGQVFGAMVYGKPFSLEGFFKRSNVTSNLDGLGVVGAEVLDFAL